MSNSEFNDIMEEYFKGNNTFKGFKENIDKTLSIAELKNIELDHIIISGGGAKNPYLKALCASYFDVSKIIMPDNSQEQVAFGNAIQSFVMNAFGKQIIESVLNGNIYIIENAKQTPIFKKGEVLPSLEYELNVDIDLNSIKLYSDISNEYICFNWEQYSDVVKIILKINKESRVVCDLVTNSSINRLKPLIKKK
jgi:hypothetical protein